MDKIVKAIPLDNYLIEIQTASGISGIFDVKPYLGGGPLKSLLTSPIFAWYVLYITALHGRMSRTSVWIPLSMTSRMPNKALQQTPLTLSR